MKQVAIKQPALFRGNAFEQIHSIRWRQIRWQKHTMFLFCSHIFVEQIMFLFHLVLLWCVFVDFVIALRTENIAQMDFKWNNRTQSPHTTSLVAVHALSTFPLLGKHFNCMRFFTFAWQPLKPILFFFACSTTSSNWIIQSTLWRFLSLSHSLCPYKISKTVWRYDNIDHKLRAWFSFLSICGFCCCLHFFSLYSYSSPFTLSPHLYLSSTLSDGI